MALRGQAADFWVAPGGDNANPGTPERPWATLAHAQQALRQRPSPSKPATVHVKGGIYYLGEPWRFTPEDSGSAGAPVLYRASDGESVVLSGGVRLELHWEPFRDGVLQARTSAGLVLDQLFVNGQRLPMARYPNYDPTVRHFNGYAADAIHPTRVARWHDPRGGYVHAMHAHEWGDMHWLILGKRSDGALELEGGWQNNRPSPMHHTYRFVENVLEELDAPGEWFHDTAQGVLYCHPFAGTDLSQATVEAVRLRHLVEFQGSPAAPVRFVGLRGFTFRHAARTFMDNQEPLLRSDWTVYRGGAVMFAGAEDCVLEDCAFDQVGGNAVFVNRYNRRITVRGCLITESGANGVAFVGDPAAVRSPLFNYSQPFDYATLDRTPGPIGTNFPADCLVEDCLITRSGRFEKQTAPIQISMSQGIVVRHCSLYEVPRAGINISEGTWGGHVIEHCDVFDTVLETGDHGSFNSWGRDRYWHPRISEVDRQVAADPRLPLLDVVQPITLRHNRWRCDHGWDVDLDDGSSHYVIGDNLFLNGGLKLREGYRRVVTNNIIVNNSLHPHCWYAASGDVFTRNIVMGPYRPAGGMPVGQWGRVVDFNLFTTSEADRMRFAAQGCDAHSLVADPQFVDANRGDFRVQAGSPALPIGFRNFPMDGFGVRSRRLREMAREPALPTVRIRPDLAAPAQGDEPTYAWRGARVRDLRGEEFSAYGVPREAGGILFVRLPAESQAFRDGFRPGDLIQTVDGKPMATVAALAEALGLPGAGEAREFGFVRQQSARTLRIREPVERPRL